MRKSKTLVPHPGGIFISGGDRDDLLRRLLHYIRSSTPLKAMDPELGITNQWIQDFLAWQTDGCFKLHTALGITVPKGVSPPQAGTLGTSSNLVRLKHGSRSLWQ
ncbi:MAG: hypothetical protein ACOYME_04665 [Prochlorotrichaceae cyanobacterium]